MADILDGFIRRKNLFSPRYCREAQIISCLQHSLLDDQQEKIRNWEATLEPVHSMSTGLFEVADEDTILGPSGVRLTKSKVLLGYILAQYIDGDDEEPTRSDCVDIYIENTIEKLKAYLFKLQKQKTLEK